MLAGGGAAGRDGGGSDLSLHEQDYFYINLSIAAFGRLRCLLFAFDILEGLNIFFVLQSRDLSFAAEDNCDLLRGKFPTLQIHSFSLSRPSNYYYYYFLIE